MVLPIILCILVGSVAALHEDDFRTNFEFFEYDTNPDNGVGYRLNEAVKPHTMNLHLDVFLSESRFDGVVTLGVTVYEAGLTQIPFHQKVESIENIEVLNSAGEIVNLRGLEPFTTDDYYELVIVHFASPLPIGNYSITVEYKGRINENPVDRGFYKGYYFLNNQEVAYATTQFQPGNARKAFPCFDEPQFKSRYTISITRDINLNPSYSNMPIADTTTVGNRVKEVFHETPIISAYLIAFHVSDFVETDSTSTPARPFKIISRPGVTNQHEYAADMGIRITNALDDFFGIQYHEMAGSDVVMKNDHIALPDFPSGAMENWGMVNYREAYLLYHQNHTNLPNKIFIATIIAHELAHKWFGNLVTTFWWSNLWLNESFASYFEYFAAHWADPELELDDQFVVDYVHSALNADASPSVNAMNWEDVANLTSITNHFSTSSYAKGASVLRTMEHLVGSRNFRSALRYYIRDNAYGVGRNEYMYAAFKRAVNEDFQFGLDYPDIDVETIFESWVENRGSPVVIANYNNVSGILQVTQRRYILSGDISNFEGTIWHIPLTWTTQSESNFNSTKPKVVLSTASALYNIGTGNQWVMMNIAQSGLYRVNYDDENWLRMTHCLHGSHRTHIHRMNRAQIANDLLYFVRSRDINQTLAFTVLEFLKDETDYYVWRAAISQLELILRRFEHLDLARYEFTAYLLDIMETVIRHLGYDERPTDSTSVILNRMQIMNLACNLNHTGCVNDALNKWRAHMNNSLPLVPVNARRYVYCVGLREGNASDYDFLAAKYQTSVNTADMVVILRALGCTKHEASLNNYLLMSTTDRRVRIHDRANVISFALQGNRENVPIVLNFIYENFATMRNEYGGYARLNIALNALPTFLTNYTLIEQFHNWAYENQIELGPSFSTAASVSTTALNNLNWGNDNVREIYDYLIARSSSSIFFASSILVLAAIFIQLFRLS